ncbi:MAG: DUF2798 domain-containing protein [Alphaproteobacteria bacterium]|uniref:DUF2798 domain-containing protein n=1 Tax=Hyphomonas sp. TaxID=87 RepID=UPI001DEAB4D4|nr:DUF2798 domain-containing protein [Hyphomonas sp.]MBU3919065.1 DUF2798 domain-containing protein [Alphaproteobacteria bacterium]MBU4063640.1 DUF2798 domain-containing protein [Alphaproteobacteria bacterium]MBU4165735.1 DUF2798 domain-containing protein [Alphaproteobacteria bacterium]MBU4567745.1 DUF2798 domain-containing protein [Alphaproteobacteria bacterium]
MTRKLPVRLFQPLFGLFMAFFMSFLMSGAITALNIGFPPDFSGRWMHAWGIAFVLAYPAILIVAPVARRLALRFAESPFAAPSARAEVSPPA